MTRPRLLDLYCGAGGAAMGYHRAGFDVVGVDIRLQPDYPFQFIHADAIGFDASGFDAVHASPPCTDHSRLWSLGEPAKTNDTRWLLQATVEQLRQLHVPWVIENVDTARFTNVPVMQLCGSSFGLQVRRHRLFASNVLIPALPCNHRAQVDLVAVYGNSDGLDGYAGKKGPRQVTTPEAREVMGMPWVTRRRGLTDAIPPAFTEYVGEWLIGAL